MPVSHFAQPDQRAIHPGQRQQQPGLHAAVLPYAGKQRVQEGQHEGCVECWSGGLWRMPFERVFRGGAVDNFVGKPPSARLCWPMHGSSFQAEACVVTVKIHINQ